MAFGYIKTHRSVTVTVGRSLDNLAVIIHTAEHYVTMWMWFVGMPDDDVRSVGYTHFLHIFLRDFKHIIIGQSVAVFRRETEGYMAAWLLDFRPRQCRTLHISDGGFAPVIFTDIQPKSIASEYIPDLFFFRQIILFDTGDVVQTTAKRIAATDFSNHNLGLNFVETVDDSVKPSKDPHCLVSDAPAFPGVAGFGDLVDVVPLPQQFSE